MSDERGQGGARREGGGVLLLAGVAGVAVLGYFVLGDSLSFETLRENRAALLAFRDAHYMLSVALFMLAYTAIVAFSLPGATLATLTGGFLFGIFPGAVFNVLAATLGAVAIFLIAKRGLGERLAVRMEQSAGAIRRLKAGIDENQWSVLFLMRLVPAVPFFVANVAPAFLGVSLFRFAVTTFLGIIPGTVVYTSVGSGLGAVFARGETPDPGIMFEPQILLPLVGLSVLAGLPVLLRAVRRMQARR